MATPKRKTSKARRNMRRSHDKLENNVISVDHKYGYAHLYHHMSKNGYYKGKKIINIIKNTHKE